MPKRNLILVLGLLAAAAVIVLFAYDPGGQTAGNRPADNRQMEAVAQAIRVIKENYHKPVDDSQLSCDAVAGMVDGLDEFSSYIPPQQVDAFNHRMRGNDQGLGIRFEIINDAVVVIGPILGSPANREGIRTGDRIVSVDGRETAGLTLEEVQDALEGPGQDEVRLVIRRRERTLNVTLTRGRLPMESVVGLYRDRSGNWVHSLDAKRGLVYIRVKEFVPDTASELEKTLYRLGSPRGIVLDLRDNPGGLLPGAVEVANFFLKKGIIVRSVDRGGKPTEFFARSEETYSDTVPLAVLINGNTASAAEIVAGALWVHDRAVIVGTQSRGKGCVQTPFLLGEGLGQINLTTAEYYLEGSMPISRRAASRYWGVEPHRQAILVQAEELGRLRVRGEVLFQPTPETMPASWPANEQGMVAVYLGLDTQLKQALALLADPAEMDTLIRQESKIRSSRRAVTAPAESSWNE